FFSFGEKLPVVVEGTSDPEGLGYAYETAAKLIASEFRDAGSLIHIEEPISTTQEKISHEELALLRMRREILDHQQKWEWRTISALAVRAGLSDDEALKIIQADPEIEFGRNADGQVL